MYNGFTCLGSYGVVLNEAHFKDLLFEAIPPPAITQTRNTSNLVMMGFPTKSNDLHPSYCVWYVLGRVDGVGHNPKNYRFLTLKIIW